MQAADSGTDEVRVLEDYEERFMIVIKQR